MTKIGKVIGILVIGGVSFFSMMVGKWYHVTVSEQIDPQRGIYGMPGLEIWIDINMRMPNGPREWACNTLLNRESADLHITRPELAVPYSCQHDFGTRTAPLGSAYDRVVDANLLQAMEGVSIDKEPALKACFAAKMATSVTPEQITALNDSSDPKAMSAVVIAVNKNVRDCRQEVGY